MDPLRAPRGVGGREAHMRLLEGRREGDRADSTENPRSILERKKKTETEKVKMKKSKPGRKRPILSLFVSVSFSFFPFLVNSVFARQKK